MTGVEAINLVQLIGACISITETVIEIGRAAQDAKGLPPKLKELFERLPAINDLLQAANERTKKDELSEESRNSIKPVLEQCKTSLEQIRGLFHKACPEDGDNYGKRFWKGTKTVFLGRDSKLQQHMNDVMENLKILELKGIFTIDGKLDDLAETVQVLAEQDPVTNAHYGTGNQNINEGPGDQFNIGGGTHNTFTNNFGSHIHQGHPEPNIADQCLQSLAFPDMEARSDINERAEHTCEWIFEHEDYRTWIDQGGLLWIKGRAGTGKSTLMNAIRERSLHVQKLSSVDPGSAFPVLVLSFFFNRRGDNLHQTAIGLFRSLLHQILRYDEKLLCQFMKDCGFEEHCRTKGAPGKDKKWDWSESDLRDLFRRYVKSVTRTRNLRLYVDALDEGGERVARQLMALFKDCGGDFAHRLSICVSCRPYPQRISTYDYCIDVVQETQQDIRRFLEEYFDEWPDWTDREASRRVKEEILSRAAGVFQWVIIVVPKVIQSREEDLATILASIANLPQDLEDLYHDMLKPLREENGKDKRMALRLFRWITFGKRPLTLAELRYAVAVDADSRLHSTEDCTHSPHWCESDDNMLKRLQRLSFGVVNLACGKVQFDHESVRDYMLARGISSLEENGAAAIANVRTRSEAIFSRVCFRYLAAGDILEHSEKVGGWRYNKRLGPEVDRGFLFGPYARDHCWSYAALADAGGQSLAYILEITEWPLLKLAYAWRMPDAYFHSWRVNGDLTLQHLAAHYGISSIFRHILCNMKKLDSRRGLPSGPRSDLDPKDHEGRTPLWWAAFQGQERVVKLLLGTERVDVNACGQWQQTPLAVAVERGFKSIVKVFFGDPSVDVNTRDKLQRTPLATAVKMGFADIVSLFLQNASVDVNCGDDSQRTPLALAVKMGHENITRLLLKNERVNANSQDASYETPLAIAVQGNHENIVELLVKSEWSDVNAQDDKQRCPLGIAAECGYAKVVRVLLESGWVNVNSRDHYGRTPLFLAVEKGHAETVRLLLARQDIDVNACDSYCKTPFWNAARLGHEEIAKMLLDTDGVLIWSRDGFGQTPLWLAAEKGSAQIVRSFLDKGLLNVNDKSYGGSGETLLELAAANGRANVVRLLLETGEVDMGVRRISSAFGLIAVEGNEDIVEMLLKIGKVDTKYKYKFCSSDLDLFTTSELREDGYFTAAEFAERRGHLGVLNLIRQYESQQMHIAELAQDQSSASEDEQSGSEDEPLAGNRANEVQQLQGQKLAHRAHGLKRKRSNHEVHPPKEKWRKINGESACDRFRSVTPVDSFGYQVRRVPELLFLPSVDWRQAGG